MNFLPISINIEDETILIVGGGQLSLHKIESLERFTHKIRLVAPEVLPEIATRRFVKIDYKKYEPSDIEGHLLVYAATNSMDLNTQIRQDGKRFRSIVNVVDKPLNCDFVSPAVYKQDNMTVAVSSNGENVYAAIHWRNQIRDLAEKGQIKTTKDKAGYRPDFVPANK